jgi:uncharacterized protein (TIGR04255 family)
MPVNLEEVFKAPMLDEVVFEARFPILLYLPKKIDEFQTQIIGKFPECKEMIQQKIPLLMTKDIDNFNNEIVWEFKNQELNTSLIVNRNRFALVSKKYKSWNHHEGSDGFYDILKHITDIFLKIYPIQRFERLGLRYINKMTLAERTGTYFKEYFHPLTDIDKYPIETLSENFCRLRIKKANGIELAIQSTFEYLPEKTNYLIDLDAFVLNTNSNDLSSRLEGLHANILSEFHSLITEKWRDKMRGKLR